MAEKAKKRRAKGEGNIRQRKDGSWEARYVIGVDPGTGKDIRKSIYTKTQKEARQKLTAAIAAIDNDDYRDPSKVTLAQWLDSWQEDYLGRVKPSTAALYRDQIRLYIKPGVPRNWRSWTLTRSSGFTIGSGAREAVSQACPRSPSRTFTASYIKHFSRRC